MAASIARSPAPGGERWAPFLEGTVAATGGVTSRTHAWRPRATRSVERRSAARRKATKHVFSGIVATLGTVERIDRRDDGSGRLLVRHGFDAALELGESICTSGVCLTVAEATNGCFAADLSEETLRRSSLGGLRHGDVVNLERSLQVGDRISGHFVFGHVDGVGRVTALEPSGGGHWLRVETDASLAPYLVDKGSIAVDGISLTMCDVTDGSFAVAVIPHTFAVTTLSRCRVGDPVNVEIDMLARYARRAIETQASGR